MTEAMKTILDFQFDKEPTPSIVLFELTRRCNLICRHCYNPPDPEPELSTEQVIAILDQIPNPTGTRVSFTGGEALVRSDFFEIIEAAAKLKFKSVNLDTNGTLLHKAVIKRLKSAGVGSIQISIDGLEGTHDWLRGSGRFAALFENIGCVIASGIDVMVNMIAHRNNKGEILLLWEKLAGLGIQTFKVEPLIAVGRGQEIDSLVLSRSDIDDVCSILKEILASPPPPELILDNVFKTFMHMKPALGCPSGRTFCVITKEGCMTHCPVFTKAAKPEDNILEKGFLRVWEQSKFLCQLRSLESLSAECRRCQYVQNCGGGCHARAKIATGSFFDKDPLCPFGENS